MAKSKFFRIAVEGATTDGRTIERVWIEQAAANYSPSKFGARVNLEHIRGIIPDGPFKAYGDVQALEARELDGEFSGKLGLFAQIAPTPELMAMTKAKQKIYTSCEIDPSFADSKQAYLIGLAVTDSPASLGTEILSFAAKNPAANPYAARKQNPGTLFTAASEAVIDLEETTAAGPSLFNRVAELLGRVKNRNAADDARFSDVTLAVEALAAHGKEQSEALAAGAGRLDVVTKQLETVTADFAAFKQLMDTQDRDAGTRPPATGGDGSVQTEF